VRVVNAGAPGYSLLQGSNFLIHRGAALEPDAVMLYFGHNDFLPVAHRVKRDASSDSQSEALTDLELFERSRRPTARAVAALTQWSNLARLALFGRERVQRDESEIVSAEGLVRVPEADRRMLLERVLAHCRAHHLELVIVIPWYRDFRIHSDLLREFAAENDIVLVDLPSEFATVPTERYFIDPLHPTERGHRMIAAAIASTLEQAWWSR
jgi:lysophospholipase L1-like esterase